MIVLGQEKKETCIIREFCEPWYKSTNIQQIFIQLIIYSLENICLVWREQFAAILLDKVGDKT